jgi:hypothetical protein
MARELKVCRQTAHGLRQALQANSEKPQSMMPLSNAHPETDKLFQDTGEKGNSNPDLRAWN